MKKLVFGIDIGGTNTAFGLVDELGEIFAESAISTRKYTHFDDYPRYIEDLAAAMHTLLDSVDFKFELLGIGVGAPNANYYKGTVEIPSNMWKYTDEQIAAGAKEEDRMFNFAEDLGKHFDGVPVYITNDANAATIGEMVYGGAKGMKNFIMITLGTGVGSGFVANGEMIYGHDGFAGEFGHVIVERNNADIGHFKITSRINSAFNHTVAYIFKRNITVILCYIICSGKNKHIFGRMVDNIPSESDQHMRGCLSGDTASQKIILSKEVRIRSSPAVRNGISHKDSYRTFNDLRIAFIITTEVCPVLGTGLAEKTVESLCRLVCLCRK